MNPVTSNKTSPKRPRKLLKGVDKAFPQAIKPHHRHKTQIGWKHLAYQGLILEMYGHSLVEMAYIVHKVCSTIVHGEHWLSKLVRKLSFFNSMCKM